MIAGESYKILRAEARQARLLAPWAIKASLMERIMITHLLKDEKEDNRIAGAVGFQRSRRHSSMSSRRK